MHLLCMLSTIAFNDKFDLITDKICNVVTNQFLSSELVSIELFAAKGLPEFAFCVGEILAKMLCCLVCWQVDSFLPLP